MRSQIPMLILVALTGVLDMGCRHAKLGRSAVEVSEWTEALDAIWEQRSTDGLAPAATVLEDMSSEARAHPDVRWRVMRDTLAKASIAEPTISKIALYATAREEGLACLDGAPSFAKRRAEWGWDEALNHIPPRRRLCASWLALAWVRWADAFGEEAAAVDLRRIDGILMALDGDTGRAVSFNRDWARAIRLSLPEVASPTERTEGKERFASLIRASSGERKLRLRSDFYGLHASSEDAERWCALRAKLRLANATSADTKAAVSSALRRGDGGLECPMD